MTDSESEAVLSHAYSNRANRVSSVGGSFISLCEVQKEVTSFPESLEFLLYVEVIIIIIIIVINF